MSAFAQYLFVDDERRPPPSVDPHAGKLHRPTWPEVVNAIERFDTSNIRMIVVGEGAPTLDMPSDGLCVVIGRQTQGPRYTYHMYDPSERAMYVLADPTLEEGDETDVLVGQPRTEDLKYCVPIELVLRALKSFYEFGKRDESLVWDVGGY